MSRLTKTLRNHLLSAIVADSKFSNLNIDHGVCAKEVAIELIEKEFNNEDAKLSYKVAREAFDAMPETLKNSMIKPHMSTTNGENGYFNSVVVSYKAEGHTWILNARISQEELPYGTLFPLNINLVYDATTLKFPEYTARLMEKFKEVDENRKIVSEFASKVTALLLSVNTVPQLKKNLPQFVKYLPEDMNPTTTQVNKGDIKEILSCIGE